LGALFGAGFGAAGSGTIIFSAGAGSGAAALGSGAGAGAGSGAGAGAAAAEFPAWPARLRQASRVRLAMPVLPSRPVWALQPRVPLAATPRLFQFSALAPSQPVSVGAVDSGLPPFLDRARENLVGRCGLRHLAFFFDVRPDDVQSEVHTNRDHDGGSGNEQTFCIGHRSPL